MRTLLCRLILSAVSAAPLAGCLGEPPTAIDPDMRSDEKTVIDVVMSPKPHESSHLARIAEMIDAAEDTIDIAMYSFSDAGISEALEAAVARGVKVRFVFETARDDKSKTGSELKSSKSGRLEAAGVNVRFVNKIMHHKFIIVDGPVHDETRADTARIASGSANWSGTAATDFDENTIFSRGNVELAIAYQREFDLMWEHSRDLVLGQEKKFELSTADLDAVEADDPNFEIFLTSSNFTISDGSTTFKTDRSQFTASDAWVAAIEKAEQSIWIASGHLRLRPVAEALEAKRAENPELDIRVYLDGQEFISESGHEEQLVAVDECLAEATTDKQRFDCENKEFLFSKQLHDAGIPLRFKYYAFRWDHSYAPQMHHKYMIVDGKELYSGSFNLSMNAEHDTFENVMHFSGDRYRALIEAFVANFEEIWVTGHEEDRLATLRDQVENDDPFPIVYPSMALGFEQVTDLKELIRDNCPQINSEPFRTEPAAHKVCPRTE